MKEQKIKKKDKKTAPADQQKSMHTPNEIIPLVRTLSMPLCEEEGIELVHVEYQTEQGGKVLRMYIDKPGGVSLEDCILVSRQMNDLLDVHFDASFSYRLEVSSPGLDRPLTKEDDFIRFAGKQAKIQTEQAVDGQKNFKGLLTGLENGRVILLTNDEKKFAIPYQTIKKARLISNDGDYLC